MMNREEAIEMWVIPALKNTWNEKKCDEILKALEQEPCDAVSRKEVMNMLHNHAFDYATSTKISALLKTMRGEVDRMPSVTPAEKVGYWTKDVNDARELFDTVRYYCSACGDWQGHGHCKYCPNCGAKMEEVIE